MHQSRHALRAVALLLLLLVLPAVAFAANVTIPTFQLLTRGIWDTEINRFRLQTTGEIDIALGGGYKFGGRLALGLNDTNFEEATSPDATYNADNIEDLLNRTLRFQSASVVVRDLFGIPLDVTYFVGEMGRLLNGDVFTEQFGTDQIGTDYRGLLYFADPDDPDAPVYDGMHAVNGTGVSFATTSTWQRLYLEASIYQDALLGAGIYSSEVRMAFNTPQFKAEAFVGGSLPYSAWGTYRAGALLFYRTGDSAEVLAQVGVPRWAPVTDGAISLDDFYFLVEPRVHIGFMSIMLTLFWHPEYYLHEATGEAGDTDIIVRLLIGDITQSAITGGLENEIILQPEGGGDTLQIAVTPFVAINASGVVWDLRADVQVFPFDLSATQGYVGVRTAF